MNVPATRVFYRNRAARAQIIINRGGRGSSKSYSIAQLLLIKFLTEKEKKILILRKTLPSLRISTWLLWMDLIDRYGVGPYIGEHRALLNYTYGRNLLHFGSLDDPEKIKSTDWNYIWIEEANEFAYEDFIILKLRLSAPSLDGKRNQIFVSFNPVDEFSWIKEKVVDGKEEKEEIVSTYKDNPFLHPDTVQMLEQLREQDRNYHRIYALGQWGRLEDLVYSNYDFVYDLPSSDDHLETIYGLDFGFNAPTALIRIMLKDGEAWEKEMLYQSGLTNAELIEKLKELVPNRSDYIFADSEEPQRIEEIHGAGFNIYPAQKSVKDGIDHVKRHKCHITHDSENLKKEKLSYAWKKDKNGHVLDEPIKFRNHAMDAERYALFTYSQVAVPGVIVV
jgi:phage terminase large subunit